MVARVLVLMTLCWVASGVYEEYPTVLRQVHTYLIRSNLNTFFVLIRPNTAANAAAHT